MNHLMKRLIDVSVAAAALLLLAPLMAAVGLAIFLMMGGPVLYRHIRPGYKARTFTTLKFRTMNDARDAQGHLLPDAERLTPLGNLLRRMSIDEQVSKWSVLKGEMSLVGERPLFA